eukprot:55471-Eustigmatos_ZCMA.PRE.1
MRTHTLCCGVQVKDSCGAAAGATENAGRRLEAVLEVRTREMVEVVKEEALRSRQQEERFIHDQERAVSSLEVRGHPVQHNVCIGV